MKRKYFMIAITICILFLSGCWSRRELNELAIAGGLGIDKEDDQFVVTFQVVNPSQVAENNGGGNKSPVAVFQSRGDTLFEAFRRVTVQSPRKIYMAHLRIVVLGEELAKEGIGEVLDFLSRDHEFRTDFYIVVSKDSNAGDILEILTSIENIPVNKLFSSLETSGKVWAPTISTTLDHLFSELNSEGNNAKLTGIIMEGDDQIGERMTNVQQAKPGTVLKYQGIGVFNGDKLVGWLNEDESKGLKYSIGEVDSTVVDVSCSKKGKVGIEVIRTKANLKTKIDNNTPKATIKLQVEGNIGDVQCKTLDLTKNRTITTLEKKAEIEIKDKIEKALDVSKEEYEIDIFGFGEAVHRSNPDYWKKVKGNWNQLFTTMPVDVEVDLQIRQTGTTVSSPLNKAKE